MLGGTLGYSEALWDGCVNIISWFGNLATGNPFKQFSQQNYIGTLPLRIGISAALDHLPHQQPEKIVRRTSPVNNQRDK